MAVSDYENLIQAAAHKYELNPALIRAIMQIESGGDPRAVSSAGANGLMQVLGGSFDPATNIDQGARELRSCSDRTNGSLRGIAICYNCGPGCLSRSSLPVETQNYITKLTSAMGSQTAQAGGGNPLTTGALGAVGATAVTDPVQEAVKKIGGTLLQPLLKPLLGGLMMLVGLIMMGIGFYILVRDTGAGRVARMAVVSTATRGRTS